MFGTSWTRAALLFSYPAQNVPNLLVERNAHFWTEKSSFCCDKWWRSCRKCYEMDCFGAHFKHVQTCDVTRVQSATVWTASVHTLTHVQTCDVTRVLSATEWISSVHTLTHVQTCDVTRVQSATEWTASVHNLTHVQTCDVTRVQSAREWTASVHTVQLHASLQLDSVGFTHCCF